MDWLPIVVLAAAAMLISLIFMKWRWHGLIATPLSGLAASGLIWPISAVMFNESEKFLAVALFVGWLYGMAFGAIPYLVRAGLRGVSRCSSAHRKADR